MWYMAAAFSKISVTRKIRSERTTGRKKRGAISVTGGGGKRRPKHGEGDRGTLDLGIVGL